MPILIPYIEELPDGTVQGTGGLVEASKLAIGTMEASSLRGKMLPNWIDQDGDRFYIRVSDPGRTGKGPIKVRVSTSSPGVGYDDDDRSGPDSEVVELAEISKGIFQSKALLLVSNDGDDKELVDGKTDNELNDRTRKVALGGSVRFELLSNKVRPTYRPDFELPVPVEKTIKIKAFVAKRKGVSVCDPLPDISVVQETFAQSGVKILLSETIVFFDEPGVNISLGDGFEIGNLSADARNLFNWIDQWKLRDSDEIGIVYVNYTTNHSGGWSYIPKNYSASKYNNFSIIGVQDFLRYSTAHELLHVLLNAEHDSDPLVPSPEGEYRQEYSDPCMTWSGGPNTKGITGRKRMSKYTLGRQSVIIKKHPYAK